jgi:hypothetical protein
VNLPRSEREALAAAVAPHPQVLAVVGGHLHRIAASTLAGRPVISAPSTYLQARPDFVTGEVEVDGGPPGFVIHAVLDGELSSQVELVPGGAVPGEGLHRQNVATVPAAARSGGGDPAGASR